MSALRRICGLFVEPAVDTGDPLETQAPAESGRQPARRVVAAPEGWAEPVPAEWAPPSPPGWADGPLDGDASDDDVPVAAAPGCVAVVSRPSDALPVGAAVALALAAERRCAAALVCVWSPGVAAPVGVGAPPHRAAARLARQLAGDGAAVRATGRLVVARLPADDGEAEAASRELLAQAAPVPVVLALGGPRGPGLQSLLAEQRSVLVAARTDGEPALGRLALSEHGDAALCPVPAGPGRTLAAAGLALTPAHRHRLLRALGETVS